MNIKIHFTQSLPAGRQGRKGNALRSQNEIFILGDLKNFILRPLCEP